MDQHMTAVMLFVLSIPFAYSWSVRNVEYSFVTFTTSFTLTVAQSAGAVEYTDCISAER